MKLLPFGDRLLVKRVVPEAKSTGGILIAESAKDFSQVAEILEMGHEVKLFQRGEKVLLTKFSGANANVDGQELLIVRSEDILGRFVNE